MRTLTEYSVQCRTRDELLVPCGLSILHAVGCTLHVVRCMLYVARCALHVVRCMLCVARCALHAASLRHRYFLKAMHEDSSEANSNSPPTVAVVKHSSTEKAQPVWKTDNFLKGYFR